MTSIGYHASHEQFSPSELLQYTTLAEKCGFASAMSSDHFTPWSVRQGQSGFAWTWLGAAMQATSFSFGSLAIPGGWRYHPAILAQAIATLCEMFPRRLPWIAAGSGEAMNERVVGCGWPDKRQRQIRLKAGVDIMRALWAGQTVDDEDNIIPVRKARLWTLPPASALPKIFAAALTEETAAWAGSWADGLIVTGKDAEGVKKIVDAFWQNGGKGKPVHLQMQVSWAETKEIARHNAYDQWRSSAICTPLQTQEIDTAEEYDQIAKDVKPEDMDNAMLVSADISDYKKALNEISRIGLDTIYLHNVGRNQTDFIKKFGAEIL